MTRTVEVRSIRNGEERLYTVTYAESTAEREEAARFFATVHPETHLHSDTDWLSDLWEMSIDEANARLCANPVTERYSLLVSGESVLADSDLYRLCHLPELQIVRIFSDRITDLGVQHFQHLSRVRVLGLHAPQITDSSLAILERLSTLQILDLQSCTKLSHESCEKLQACLEDTRCWFPFRSPTNASTRRAKTHARDA